MASVVEVISERDALRIMLTHSLNPDMYDFPLTLKTYVPGSWKSLEGTQAGKALNIRKLSDENGDYVLYDAIPNGGEILLLRE